MEFSGLNCLSKSFILLIYVKMHINIYEQDKFYAELSMKKVKPLGLLADNSRARVPSTIRILHMSEVRIEKSVQRVTVWHYKNL